VNVKLYANIYGINVNAVTPIYKNHKRFCL